MGTFEGTQQNQLITLCNRSQLTVSGVEDVKSFDDRSIILKSTLGMLAIDGEELHIDELSCESGVIRIEGNVGGIIFFEQEEPRKKRRLFGG